MSRLPMSTPPPARRSSVPPEAPLIVVCGMDAGEIEEATALLLRSGPWRTANVCWPDPVALEAARLAPARGYLLAAERAEPSEELLAALDERPDDAPIVAIGAATLMHAGPECWFPRRPPATLLRSVLGSLVPVPDPQMGPMRWRRRSDMIIGRAPAIRTLLKTLGRLSDSLSTVLITGESGTGKELAARALHYGGPRGARGRFIAVNCAAIPESLFEAELFGYERGAFTGASSSRAGVFEAADGGTLFLDEVGELPLHIQPKLLRIIETRMVTRLGSTAPRLVNVRIVSATARDLEAGMEEGTFRRDLFYRLSVYPVEIPALRTRIEDIPAIVAHHLKEIARRDNVPVPPIEPAALRKLMTFPWPGNVRELVNVVERATLVAGPDGIDPSHIELPEALTTLPPYREAKRDFERDYYTRLLQAAGGNVSLAGRMAEKTRKEIYDAVRRLELRGPPSSRS